ncbi:glycosyltransferase family 2 protein [Neobacillus drentensis]|uniref:glycosyltransferase family 2 protein n=1 Tax=Neobacillus drentensis TaxID=220684 RepID=UPI0030002341
MKNKMIAFVILNYNTWEMTIRCVESIFQTCQQKYTIYIVDNGSTNDSYEQMEKEYRHHEKVVVIKSENLGYARGNNNGIRQAMKDGYDIITVTNNDVIFLEDSIDRMYLFLESNKNASVAAPYILSPEGVLHNLPTLKKVSNRDYLLHHTRLEKFLSKESKRQYDQEYNLTGTAIRNEPIPIYKFSGCCFMAKREMLEEVGLFDENTFLYFEEDIICQKMVNSDYQAYFLPDSKIVHHHGLTTGKDNLFVDTEMLKSEMYFLSKYNRMNFWSMLMIYIDRAITSIMKIIKKRYHNASIKDYMVFLGKTWKHFIKNTRQRNDKNTNIE